jgi:hypothetical protein
MPYQPATAIAIQTMSAATNGQESLSLVRVGGDGSGIETLKQSRRHSRGM